MTHPRRSPQRVSISFKLMAAFGLALSLIVGMGVFGLAQLHKVNRFANAIRTVQLPQIETLEQIRRWTSEHRLLATRQVQTTEFRQLAEIATEIEASQKLIAAAEAKYLASAPTPQERALFSIFRRLWEAYGQALASVQARLENGELAAASAEFDRAVLGTFENAARRLEDLIGITKEAARQAAEDAAAVYRWAILLTLGCIVAATVLTSIVILWISSDVSMPLLRIAEAMRRLAEGQDDVPLDDRPQRQDEIGVLMEAVAGYRDALASSRRFSAEARLEHHRLQAAISNMPLGLSMFDAGERLIICNEAYAALYGLPASLTRPGTTLEAILRQVNRTLLDAEASEAGVQEVLERYRAELRQGVTRYHGRHLREMSDGRTISVILHVMAGGGWVAVHEDVTERHSAERRIRHMARHDALTDLPNRVLFRERITEALAAGGEGERVAVLCLDLDHFKDVNDTLGHPVGDRLLQAVAARLRECVRMTDTVARLGGDEFAIIQRGAPQQPQAAAALAVRLIETIGAPYQIDGHRLVIGTSVGIAVAPEGSTEPDEILKNSDMALYAAKAGGRSNFCHFDPEMEQRLQSRRRLETDLRQAVETGAFEMRYQPVVDVTRNRVTGFEALLRWRHPERGLLPPSEFLQVAEEIGAIVPIGMWVLQHACHDAALWPDGVKVAVNISPRQFRGQDLREVVAGALWAAGLPPQRLELEITETALLADSDATFDLLHRLRASGVGIAMDDFGTGYSSLSHVRRFPFDRIKLDRSFVASMDSDAGSLAVIRAVAGLGANLGMAITAEGVETEGQVERLRAEGYHELQGYYFGRPSPAEAVPGIILRPQGARAAA
ncbi:EAL domain-containing protein [Rhodovastum atsumiense]|nr:EAL domain-containing protein [Rhodovastum atsumiense]